MIQNLNIEDIYREKMNSYRYLEGYRINPRSYHCKTRFWTTRGHTNLSPLNPIRISYFTTKPISHYKTPKPFYDITQPVSCFGAISPLVCVRNPNVCSCNNKFNLCEKKRNYYIIICFAWHTVLLYTVYCILYCIYRGTSKLLELVPNPFDDINKICSKQNRKSEETVHIGDNFWEGTIIDTG